MSKLVPPIEIPVIFGKNPKRIGNTAMIAKKIAPTSVILVKIFEIKSDVGLPGLIPGTKPPFPLILFDISIGVGTERFGTSFPGSDDQSQCAVKNLETVFVVNGFQSCNSTYVTRYFFP